jgi:hypothetical protein
VSNLKKGSSTSANAPARGNNEDYLARFRNGTLDDDVLQHLERIGPNAAEKILRDFENKMESGEVRNPSAYVMRSISNHDKGGR